MKITGKVFDKAGDLPGASVYISDADGKLDSSINGVPTDINGEYSIDNIDPNQHKYISVSFVGYDTVTKRIDELLDPTWSSVMRIDRIGDLSIPYNVEMSEKTAGLPEFQVVAKKGLKWYWWALIGITVLTLLYFLVIRKK